MKESTKATLWSIFVLPGSGHFYLKKPVPGTIIVGVTLIALIVVVNEAVKRAMQIVDKVVLGEIPFDILVILEQVSMQSAQADSQLLNITTYALVAIWLFAAIDAYRIGRRVDSLASASTATMPNRKQ
jgi:hypothetical protein